MVSSSSTAAAVGVGPLVRRWREARRFSQLALAVEANVSARHLSFVETGRAQPSRELLMRLARRLDLPARDRNALLLAGGFAPIYRETPLNSPEMAQVRHALELTLRAHEPFGAIVVNGRWDLVMVNAGYARMAQALLGGEPLPPYALLPPPRLNVVQLVFDPAGLRPLIANWPRVAKAMFSRERREAAGHPAREEIIEQILAFPGVAELEHEPDADASELVIPLELKLGDRSARLFSTIATLGTARDITLQELSIESFHPADADTEALVRELSSH